eukprot:CAMPEP_0174990822 /NCGR_PEP_ID=MMETSP0004_2-20121128/21535_1 /TAXON_ID=420556 /ORGANISM="Ochromonas sp., Strain CCMP1393" /LENGTH=674 /DNA_ID=CAMNT_0016244473 /DNA_START=126 /DNA_END=2150 /DNA_ORIENTATION=+
MSISSDEVNFLIYRYLSENGFTHSAFTFAYESLVIKSSTAQTEIPPGALITFLQKGLEYIAIEEHINEDGTIQDYDNNFSLLSPLICEAVAVKEDRRSRRTAPAKETSAPDTSSSSTGKSTSAAVSASGEASGAATKSGAGAGTGTGEGGSASIPMEEDGNDGHKKVGTKNESTVTTTVEGSSASGFTPSSLELVKEKTGSRYLQLNGHQGEVFMCLWNPTQQQLATGSADGMCRLWGLADMTADKWSSDNSDIKLVTSIMPHCQTEGEKFKDVTSVTWSPDGKFLATGCYDGMARIWDSQGKFVRHLKEHTGPVFSLKWSKNGMYILSGSYDRRSIVWEAKTGQIVKVFMLHTGPVLDVDWQDCDTFATCSSDRSIFICQASSKENNKPLRCLTGHEDEVNAVCWSPGGQLLASCSDDSTAKIWTVEDGLKYDLQGHLKEIFTLRWTPTGPKSKNPDKPVQLCTASFDGTVKVWSGSSGVLLFNLCKQVQPVYSLAPSPNGEYIATGSLGGNVSIWSLAEGQSVRELDGFGDTFDVSWSADGSLLCSCFSSGRLCVIDTSITVNNKPSSSSSSSSSSAVPATKTSVLNGSDFDVVATVDSVPALPAATTSVAAATPAAELTAVTTNEGTGKYGSSSSEPMEEDQNQDKKDEEKVAAARSKSPIPTPPIVPSEQ